MKQIIEVEMKARTVDPIGAGTDVLAVGHFSDAKGPDRTARELDAKLDGAIERVMKLGDFKGKSGTSAIVYGNDEIGARRVLLVGLGERKKARLETLRQAASQAAKKSVAVKAERLSLALHRAFGGRFGPDVMGRAMAEGVCFGSYRYDEFVTKDEDERRESLKVELIDPDAAKTRSLNKGMAAGLIIGRAQSYARTMANRPANVISPATLAAAAKKLARGSKNLSCTVFDEKQMAAKGMGGVLAVGSGSQNKPRFIVLK
ncbi:MAG: M17 family peptidase N-terminal domain-containing protein, partial [Planctomycetota bacterium]